MAVGKDSLGPPAQVRRNFGQKMAGRPSRDLLGLHGCWGGGSSSQSWWTRGP